MKPKMDVIGKIEDSHISHYRKAKVTAKRHTTNRKLF
jgi:hypothetical protein